MATSAPDVANLPHDNRQAQAFAITFVFPSIATVALALRMYGRSLTRSFGADDLVICFAMIVYWAETYTTYKVLKYGHIGIHLWDLPPHWDFVSTAKYGYATELLYNPILALVKTSILLFLLRLTGQKTNVTRAIIALIIFNGLMMITTFLLTTFQCVPISANWYPARYPNAHCMDFELFVVGTAAVSIVTDILALLMPTWIVYNLQIERRKKLMLVGILSFGFITVIIGIVRIILLDDFARNPPPDITYSLILTISTVEVGLAFVCACAPALKPVIVRITPKFFKDGSRWRTPKISIGSYGQEARGRRPEGYKMSGRSVRHTTEIEACDVPDGNYNKISDVTDMESGHGTGDGMHNSRMGIAVRTETEVNWHDSISVRHGSQPAKEGVSSTERLG